jgi:hypothetical protein
MTAGGAAAVTAGVVSGAGSAAALLASPVPLLVLGALALAVWAPIAVLLLTPVWSSDPEKCTRAQDMLDHVLAAIPGSRPATASSPPDQLETQPASISAALPAVGVAAASDGGNGLLSEG